MNALVTVNPSKLQVAAAASQRAASALDEARAALSKYEAQAHRNADRLAALEADLHANRTACALGNAPEVAEPDLAEIERCRADVTVAVHVTAELKRRVASAAQTAEAADRRVLDEKATFVREHALTPAREELAAAWESVREAGAKVMAAHTLAYHTLVPNGDRGPYASALDVSGPVSLLFEAIRRLDWPGYPYAIRPDWLPQNGQFWPDELPGVQSYTEAAKAMLDQELAA